jgi:hypothetical protein
MFDYTTLVGEVRRLIGDSATSYTDIREQSYRDSYYVKLSQEGFATPSPSGVVVNGVPVPSDEYTVNRNIIRFTSIIPTGTEIMVDYSIVRNQDDLIIGYIGDSVHSLVETCMNTDLGFGDGTTTDQDVSMPMRSLIAHGAALNILGVRVMESSEDAVYIRDGDSVIDTTKGGTNMSAMYKPLLETWWRLKETIQLNVYDGVTMF